MKKAAQTLEAYNRALHKAHVLTDLYVADRDFRKRNKLTDKAAPILDEHIKRVKGLGCPADCDDITERMMRR